MLRYFETGNKIQFRETLSMLELFYLYFTHTHTSTHLYFTLKTYQSPENDKQTTVGHATA